ncbi:hypothetical protein PCYB_082870 [Plasmodium cynomolgi strain B]|uniref:Uncharacterized protein n=1 Tax=Plasmodium cynomolgi (strain B) TaxID=1120755 RepID=K6UD78_PLACD|nr:hypothetical protein PCYB_082870 [Plasmodium cynomolgi strain B]GAB66126.1 hypothetical protein PCYB_082870 [Plasmodium cynomolgi strain B]
MIDDNLTVDESDNNLFDGRIKFFKSDETNSFHSVEPVVASDDEGDEDAEEEDDQDEPGGPDDVEEGRAAQVDGAIMIGTVAWKRKKRKKPK